MEGLVRTKGVFRAVGDTVAALANLHFASLLIGNAARFLSGGESLEGAPKLKTTFASAIQRLPEDDAALLLEFFEWLFKRNNDRGVAARFVSWWYARAFRAHIGSMTSVYEPDGAQQFLEKIAAIIKEQPGREEGYGAVLQYFSVLGVPHAPDKSFAVDMSLAKHLLSGVKSSGDNLVELLRAFSPRSDSVGIPLRARF
ncbi:MAG: hypothetical protein ACXIUO_10740 [Erythrobacter sp.]